MPIMCETLYGENAMKCKHSAKSLQNRRRTQRGAALIFALAAVIIITTLTLATGRLIGEHLALEQKAEGYSRAINIAEAALNWQLNRMSRSKLPGDNTVIAGRLNYEDVNLWDEANDRPAPYIGELPAAELGTNFTGRVTVWVRTSAAKWTAPGFFELSALGQDPKTGITRGVQIVGQPIGLSDQYALFGQNEVRFQNEPTESGSANIVRGYIGSNALVSHDNVAVPTGGAEYFGCRLGPNAALSPTASAWRAGWDFPRLSDMVQLPTVEQVIGFMYRGRTVADCATQNDNTQIEYLNDGGTFSPLRKQDGDVVTQLTDAEFSRSAVHRTLRLHGSETAANGNLFYFTQITMAPGDTLILDSREYIDPSGNTPPVGSEHSIRIVVNNSDPNSRTVITNLAYFHSLLDTQVAGEQDRVQSYFWFNNTPGEFAYQPSQPADPNFYLPPGFTAGGPLPPFKIQRDTTLRGVVYGINGFMSAGNAAGDIKVSGKTAFPVKVRSLIGNHVRLLGPAQVEWESAEDKRNSNMYVLHYSIINRTYGELDPDVIPSNMNDPGRQASPVYDYGR